MAAPPREVYLASDFEPASLKVAQLRYIRNTRLTNPRSILLEQNTYYPSNSKKADLVQLFETEVRPRAAEILKASRVKASGRGIMAVSSTGEETPVEPPTGTKRGRGRSRVSTVEVPTTEVEVVIETQPPTKRPRSRRSTAEPEAAAPPKRKPGRPRKIKEEDLMDVDTDDVSEASTRAPRRVSRAPATELKPTTEATPRRKSARPVPQTEALQLSAPPSAPPTAPSTARKPRTSFMPQAKPERDSTPERPTPAENSSPFSDFNPFQSGSEEAAERARRRRKSSIGLGETKRRAPRPSEWTATSQPSASILRRVNPGADDVRHAPSEVRSAYLEQVEAAEDHNRAVEEKFGGAAGASKDEPEVSVTQTQQQQVKAPRKAIIRKKAQQVAPTTPTLSGLLLALLALCMAGHYKSMSAANGFCDTGLTTNNVIKGREMPIHEAQTCIARRTAEHLDNPSSSLANECNVQALPLVPFLPRPTSCTPCPHNAICADGEVQACAPEYILTPSVFSPLSIVVDGWPGMPSRVFPPSCRPDTARMRQVGALARQIEQHLARGRGAVECAGVGAGDGRKGEGERFGTTETALRESLAERRVSSVTREQFDDIFDSAIKDLVEHGDLIESIDVNGMSWYAAKRSDMSLVCRAKLDVKTHVDEWKSELTGTAGVLMAIWLLTRMLAKQREEKKHIRELSEQAIRRLQDQEYRHYVDNVITPQPYLPTAKLRDVILAHEPQAVRARLWPKVEEAVEKNANVQRRDRELGGDVWKTWEWNGVARIEPDATEITY